MPTSVVAVVVLLVLALPGYVYQRRVRRRSPERSSSAFEEVLVILFSGAAIDTVVVLLLVLGGVWVHAPFPRFDRLISTPKEYLAQNIGLMSLWSAVSLATAVGLAFLVASPRWRRLGAKVLPGPTERRVRGNPSQSAWWLLFNANRGHRIYVGCMLTDGAYIAGYLHSYSTLVAETRDRELTLAGEVRYRAAGATDTTVLPKVNAVSVSAERIQILTVTYVEPTPESPAPTILTEGTADEA